MAVLGKRTELELDEKVGASLFDSPISKESCMAHTSIWVPGTIVEAEHPDQLAALIRKGWGTFFEQEGGFSWFHIPIAAPFALDGQNLVLTTVFAFYKATNGLIVRNIHVFSGSRRVQAFDCLHFAGEQTEMKDSNLNMLDLSPHVFITAGLGISVGVDFKDGGEILFPVPAATFNRLSNFTSQLIRSELGVA
jgi:hypothetical protein